MLSEAVQLVLLNRSDVGKVNGVHPRGTCNISDPFLKHLNLGLVEFHSVSSRLQAHHRFVNRFSVVVEVLHIGVNVLHPLVL